MEAKAKYPFGSRLRGSPIAELSALRKQARQQILKNPMKRNAAAERKMARKFEKFQASLVSTIDPKIDAAINAICLYLKPRLIKGSEVTMVRICEMFEGVTGANLVQQKPEIIRRIKAETKGELIEAAASLDGDLARILDTAATRQASHKWQHGDMQRRAEAAEGEAKRIQKGERK
jgi:hypothetical protein